MEDALTVDAFVEGASLHDDGHGQQDLLADVLLEAAATGEGWSGGVKESVKKPAELRGGSSEVTRVQRRKSNKWKTEASYQAAKSQLQLVFFGLFRAENFFLCVCVCCFFALYITRSNTTQANTFWFSLKHNAKAAIKPTPADLTPLPRQQDSAPFFTWAWLFNQRNTQGGQLDHGATMPCRQCVSLASVTGVVAGALRGSEHTAGCRPDSV